MMRRSALPVIVGAAFLGGAVGAPAQIGKPSPLDQLKLGKRAADEIRAREKVLPSSDPRVRTVRRIAGRLLATFDDKDKPWEYSFDVIDGNEVNAFALPGGPMFVYTGLLDKMKTEDELAGVIGHELTHVRREHWAYQYRDEQARSLGISLIMTVLRVNDTLSGLIDLSADVLVNLPYSRGHENEADDGGFQMVADAGYNPQGMADLFKMLKESSRDKPPEFLSTHPADEARIARIESKVKDSKTAFSPEVPIDLDYYKEWPVLVH